MAILDPDSKGPGIIKYDSWQNPLSSIGMVSNNIYIITKEEWKAAYNQGTSIGKDPYIGMNREQVLVSSWGKPNDINSTKNIDGVIEQWVYSGSKYIYLDNGIVTTIQE